MQLGEEGEGGGGVNGSLRVAQQDDLTSLLSNLKDLMTEARCIDANGLVGVDAAELHSQSETLHIGKQMLHVPEAKARASKRVGVSMVLRTPECVLGRQHTQSIQRVPLGE